MHSNTMDLARTLRSRMQCMHSQHFSKGVTEEVSGRGHTCTDNGGPNHCLFIPKWQEKYPDMSRF
jgi:hypothetical protein